FRQPAREVLARGFGEGKMQAVKDPRFCLTLAFWLSLCEDLCLPVSVCVIQRAPLEVAQSLCKRDEFPLGYGLRLYASYLRALLRALPERTFWVSYEGLLANPAVALAELIRVLPLGLSSPALDAALRADLRHQVAAADALLLAAPSSTAELDAFTETVASKYPVEDTLTDFARRLVARGRELTRIGNAHSEALATLDQRDADIGRLAGEHTGALETLNERDAQIVSLTRSMQEYDETLREKDAHLQSLFSKPLIGLLFRALWKYETR
ncbi:MAG: hypothetical protein KDI09_18495, partial [Halioglobus sp.]|nr:hypothetical protein [Halioglobus sp.]